MNELFPFMLGAFAFLVGVCTQLALSIYMQIATAVQRGNAIDATWAFIGIAIVYGITAGIGMYMLVMGP